MKKKSKRKVGTFFLAVLALILIFSGYQFLLRPILKKTAALEIIDAGIILLFGAALIIILLMIFILILYLIILKFQKSDDIRIWKSYTKKSVLALVILLILIGGFTYYSQINAYTKPLCNEYNDEIPISISKLEKVKIDDKDEWISIRGKNKNNPILLVLSDGPGKSQMAFFNKTLKGLEDNFVIVNWDEIGAGKSYKAGKELTINDYVSDGIEITRYLCEKYNKNKIYILGNSFGSVLGISMVKNTPDLYEGFIGMSQIVSVRNNEEYRYNKALDIANSKGDEKEIRKLKAQGRPPYEKDSYGKQKVYSDYLRKNENENNKIHGDRENALTNIFSSEYGILDKVNTAIGEGRTYNKLYNSCYDIDLLNSAKDVNIPMYFFQGKYDDLSSSDALNEYYNTLNAPKKEIVWFESSGSKLWINESDKFVNTVNEKLLK